MQHLVEHILDEIVLRFEECDGFVWRFDNHFGHGNTSGASMRTRAGL
jgi:hypothetical protein